MGMGKTGIPWVLWDSHGNGSKISHGMGIRIKCMGMGIKTWEWEKHCIQHGVRTVTVGGASA